MFDYKSINWNAVGADNLPEESFGERIVDTKVSMLLWRLFLKRDFATLDKILARKPEDEQDEHINLTHIPNGQMNQVCDNLFSKYKCRKHSYNYSDSTFNIESFLYSDQFVFRIEQTTGEYNLIQPHTELYEYCRTKGIQNFLEFVENQNAEDGLFETLQMGRKKYSGYTINDSFESISLFYFKARRTVCTDNCSSIIEFQNKLLNIFLCGFPYTRSYLTNCYGNHYPLFTCPRLPLFNDSPSRNKMIYVLERENTNDFMLIVKLYINNGLEWRKAYLPVVFFNNFKSNLMFFAFTGLPKSPSDNNSSGGYLPLYKPDGISRIKRADTIVLCNTIEDADILQKENSNNHETAFVSFVCDEREYEQVDFSLLKGKTVIILISNHSFKRNEDIFEDAIGLYNYLKRNTAIGIKEFGFIKRYVNYTPFDIKNALDFNLLLDGISIEPFVDNMLTEFFTESQLNYMGPSPSFDTLSSLFVKPESLEQNKRRKGKRKIYNVAVKKMILRPFIRRGCTTVLLGDPEVGKSRFAMALAAQVAGSSNNFLKERFWTRCLPPKSNPPLTANKDNPILDSTLQDTNINETQNHIKPRNKREDPNYKVVYWVFDDVDREDLEEQKNQLMKSIKQSRRKNLFIEIARTIVPRDKETLKVHLRSYENKGVYGQPVDLLVIDTLHSFCKDAISISQAYDTFVQLKDDLPNLAILVLHHKNKEGTSFGGVPSTNKPRIIIEKNRLSSNSDNNQSQSIMDFKSIRFKKNNPTLIKVVKNSFERTQIDALPFIIELDEKGNYCVKEPDFTIDDMKKILICEYKNSMSKKYTNADIACVLGCSDRTIQNTKISEVEMRDLFEKIEAVKKKYPSQGQ